MIPEKLLIDSGAEIVTYHKQEYIFKEGQHADFYYQILSGEIKMNNYNEEGKEFIQSIFSAERSFGEPPLFADIAYPANAISISKAKVLRLSKSTFYDLLVENPQVHLEITKALSLRLYYKAIMATELSHEQPGHRILRFLDYLKKDVHHLKDPFSFEVQLTRQQIADLTGLRVETVIRATKVLEERGEIQIKNRKIHR